MKFLIVGLGSMGKRRIRNLKALGIGDITGFDPRTDRRQEAEGRYGTPTFESFEAAMTAEPDALIISTPPDLHTFYALQGIRKGKHCFIEASVIDDGLAETEKLVEGSGLVVAPSCTLRFHPLVQTIKRLIETDQIGRVLGFTYHSGQYLPDWHPWERISEYYVSRRETGGCREIVPFELTWLTWILGPVSTVSCMKSRTNFLEADIDDIYQVLLRFGSGLLGHLMVDVVSRTPIRFLRLIGESGTIEWNWSETSVRMYSAQSRSWQTFSEPPGYVEPGYLHAETMYVKEMEQFLKALSGKEPYGYTIGEDRRILSLLRTAELSSEQARHLVVS